MLKRTLFQSSFLQNPCWFLVISQHHHSFVVTSKNAKLSEWTYLSIHWLFPLAFIDETDNHLPSKRHVLLHSVCSSCKLFLNEAFLRAWFHPDTSEITSRSLTSLRCLKFWCLHFLLHFVLSQLLTKIHLSLFC